MEIFLGGTVNNSNWRDYIMSELDNIYVDYFNPVVEDWDETSQQLEIEKRESCDLVLYVITPKMTGVYSIAESVYDACMRPEKTIFCVLDNDDNNEWTEHQHKSLEMTKQLIKDCGAYVAKDLDDVVNYINYLKSGLNNYLDY
jgi:hypothetical protein